MAPAAVIVSRLQLVRQGIAERLALVGADVDEFAEASAALQALRERIPDLIILDIEDKAWSWRPLLQALAEAHRRVRIVLLARSMGIDEAAEAKRLGIAGVILKPFREEDHMQRLLEIMERGRGVTPRRVYPRFYPDSASQSVLAPTGALTTLYRIVNISVGGACVQEARSGLQGLEDGPTGTLVRVSTGGIHLGVACRVIERADGLIRAQFVSMGAGRADFVEHMAALQSRVFGPRRARGRW